MSVEKSNILIVDDNKDHQILMEEALMQFIRGNEYCVCRYG